MKAGLDRLLHIMLPRLTGPDLGPRKTKKTALTFLESGDKTDHTPRWRELKCAWAVPEILMVIQGD